MLTVLKTFATPNQYFAEGRELDPAELDGPIPLAHWQAQGFVSTPAAPQTGEVSAIAAAEARLAADQARLASLEAAAKPVPAAT